ncbi:Hypothetical predicted protein [Scomber scombrus]|uniref:Uncharacterized protein n=1 Tax=Scomber scombrus TaxID=13677 RepID=A0AAV1MV34_SCOSC
MFVTTADRSGPGVAFPHGPSLLTPRRVLLPFSPPPNPSAFTCVHSVLVNSARTGQISLKSRWTGRPLMDAVDLTSWKQHLNLRVNIVVLFDVVSLQSRGSPPPPLPPPVNL